MILLVQKIKQAMADYESKQQKFVELDLDGIPKDVQQEAKEAVGDFLIQETMDRLASGKSPVKGERFKQLSKDYAIKQKGGDRTPNLYLEGDMQEALGYKVTKDGLVFGIQDESQRDKADGHNNFSGKSALPRRRFIPGEDQDFTNDIQRGIEDILDGFKVEAKEIEATSDETSLGSLLSNQSIEQILLRRLRGE